jgi:hypothetical protein
MKHLRFALPLLTTLLVAGPAAAQVAGDWKVSGQINGKAFTADCRFTSAAAGFGGVCVDAANGKKHVLSAGSIAGSQVQFRYPASYMMMTFDVVFTGTLKGAAMNGTVSAKGRQGVFTASRD